MNKNEDLFIKVYPNSLPGDICDEIIKRFKKDTRTFRGTTKSGFKPHIKNSWDLYISIYEDWKDIDEILYAALHKALADYKEHVSTMNAHILNINNHDIYDRGFNVKKYIQNDGFYHWHEDSLLEDKRIITYLWYLNDVTVGGETEFMNYKIKPTTGTLVLFPATWTYVHKGNMPVSSDKFIITGWVSRTINEKKPTKIL